MLSAAEKALMHLLSKALVIIISSATPLYHQTTSASLKRSHIKKQFTDNYNVEENNTMYI